MARQDEDPKAAALRAERSLNPRPEAVSDERFVASEFFDSRDLVQVKYEMVRRVRVRVDGDAVSRSAAAFGFSRPSFYEAQAALEEGGLAGLVPARPGPRRAHKLTTRSSRSRASGSPPIRRCGRRISWRRSPRASESRCIGARSSERSRAARPAQEGDR
jgi:hypothetical protein